MTKNDTLFQVAHTYIYITQIRKYSPSLVPGSFPTWELSGHPANFKGIPQPNGPIYLSTCLLFSNLLSHYPSLTSFQCQRWSEQRHEQVQSLGEKNKVETGIICS